MLTQILTHLRTSLGDFFRALPAWFRTRYLWILLVVPAAWSVIAYRLSEANVMGWRDVATNKDAMEILHPAFLIAGTLIALSGWAVTRHASLAFLGVMCALFLSREVGGQGTSVILYIGLVALIAYGHAKPDKVSTFIDSRWASSLMATGFICYAFSQLLDRGAAKRVVRLFLWDSSWELQYSSQIEESLEALGGALLVLAVLTTVFLVVRHKRGSGSLETSERHR